tara:strand:- start:267 stop:428 length:162 start_codon:yes stop_codon:yes gene_type:complete
MNFIKDNIDVLAINTLSIGISLSNVEQILQIIGLVLGIIYTLDKYIHYRKNRK